SVEKDILEQVAKILKLPVEAIENFDEEQAVNIISNTFNTHDQSNGMNVHPTFNFNPLDKMVELYERMIQQQKEMIEKLEQLIKKQ
ncbi:XRE family transcriptional regulator, partial [Elizabethkingia anophelis]|nr:XRE family transcriptional regulator [Elizabethkingia anophelis]